MTAIMKKHIKDLLTIFVITSCIVAYSAFANAFVGPTAVAPLNNATGPIDSSTTPQAKGGPVVPGSLLNINGLTSSSYLIAWNNFVINQHFTISSLAGVGTRPVCIDATHKLVICSGTPPPVIQNYNSVTNIGAITGICTISPNPYGGSPGYLKAVRDSATETNASSRGVTSVDYVFRIKTDNQTTPQTSTFTATFLPGVLEVDLGVGSINHDGGGYCSSIVCEGYSCPFQINENF
jgi:hypothetical protein